MTGGARSVDSWESDGVRAATGLRRVESRREEEEPPAGSVGSGPVRNVASQYTRLYTAAPELLTFHLIAHAFLSTRRPAVTLARSLFSIVVGRIG